MKNIFLFIVISVAVFINSGCSSKLMSFEKRKYNKGYHIDFADKNHKRNTNASSNDLSLIPAQSANEIITANMQSSYSAVPELRVEDAPYKEEVIYSANENQKVKSTENKKFFQNPVFKHFSGAKIKATAKHSLEKLTFRKNTAGTNQTAGTSFFSILGAIIGGGALVALAVMLFSNWASVTITIILLSSIALGLILLIVGANM